MQRSFEMFTSFVGTWLPFALIFGSTYITGVVVAPPGHREPYGKREILIRGNAHRGLAASPGRERQIGRGRQEGLPRSTDFQVGWTWSSTERAAPA